MGRAAPERATGLIATPGNAAYGWPVLALVLSIIAVGLCMAVSALVLWAMWDYYVNGN